MNPITPESQVQQALERLGGEIPSVYFHKKGLGRLGQEAYYLSLRFAPGKPFERGHFLSTYLDKGQENLYQRVRALTKEGISPSSAYQQSIVQLTIDRQRGIATEGTGALIDSFKELSDGRVSLEFRGMGFSGKGSRSQFGAIMQLSMGEVHREFMLPGFLAPGVLSHHRGMQVVGLRQEFSGIPQHLVSQFGMDVQTGNQVTRLETFFESGMNRLLFGSQSQREVKNLLNQPLVYGKLGRDGKPLDPNLQAMLVTNEGQRPALLSDIIQLNPNNNRLEPIVKEAINPQLQGYMDVYNKVHGAFNQLRESPLDSKTTLDRLAQSLVGIASDDTFIKGGRRIPEGVGASHFGLIGYARSTTNPLAALRTMQAKEGVIVPAAGLQMSIFGGTIDDLPTLVNSGQLMKSGDTFFPGTRQYKMSNVGALSQALGPPVEPTGAGKFAGFASADPSPVGLGHGDILHTAAKKSTNRAYESASMVYGSIDGAPVGTLPMMVSPEAAADPSILRDYQRRSTVSGVLIDHEKLTEDTIRSKPQGTLTAFTTDKRSEISIRKSDGEFFKPSRYFRDKMEAAFPELKGLPGDKFTERVLNMSQADFQGKSVLLAKSNQAAREILMGYTKIGSGVNEEWRPVTLASATGEAVHFRGFETYGPPSQQRFVPYGTLEGKGVVKAFYGHSGETTYGKGSIDQAINARAMASFATGDRASFASIVSAGGKRGIGQSYTEAMAGVLGRVQRSIIGMRDSGVSPIILAEHMAAIAYTLHGTSRTPLLEVGPATRVDVFGESFSGSTVRPNFKFMSESTMALVPERTFEEAKSYFSTFSSSQREEILRTAKRVIQGRSPESLIAGLPQEELQRLERQGIDEARLRRMVRGMEFAFPGLTTTDNREAFLRADRDRLPIGALVDEVNDALDRLGRDMLKERHPNLSDDESLENIRRLVKSKPDLSGPSSLLKEGSVVTGLTEEGRYAGNMSYAFDAMLVEDTSSAKISTGKGRFTKLLMKNLLDQIHSAGLEVDHESFSHLFRLGVRYGHLNRAGGSEMGEALAYHFLDPTGSPKIINEATQEAIKKPISSLDDRLPGFLLGDMEQVTRAQLSQSIFGTEGQRALLSSGAEQTPAGVVVRVDPVEAIRKMLSPLNANQGSREASLSAAREVMNRRILERFQAIGMDPTQNMVTANTARALFESIGMNERFLTTLGRKMSEMVGFADGRPILLSGHNRVRGASPTLMDVFIPNLERFGSDEFTPYVDESTGLLKIKGPSESLMKTIRFGNPQALQQDLMDQAISVALSLSEKPDDSDLFSWKFQKNGELRTGHLKKSNLEILSEAYGAVQRAGFSYQEAMRMDATLRYGSSANIGGITMKLKEALIDNRFTPEKIGTAFGIKEKDFRYVRMAQKVGAENNNYFDHAMKLSPAKKLVSALFDKLLYPERGKDGGMKLPTYLRNLDFQFERTLTNAQQASYDIMTRTFNEAVSTLEIPKGRAFGAMAVMAQSSQALEQAAAHVEATFGEGVVRPRETALNLVEGSMGKGLGGAFSISVSPEDQGRYMMNVSRSFAEKQAARFGMTMTEWTDAMQSGLSASSNRLQSRHSAITGRQPASFPQSFRNMQTELHEGQSGTARMLRGVMDRFFVGDFDGDAVYRILSIEDMLNDPRIADAPETQKAVQALRKSMEQAVLPGMSENARLKTIMRGEPEKIAEMMASLVAPITRDGELVDDGSYFQGISKFARSSTGSLYRQTQITRGGANAMERAMPPEMGPLQDTVGPIRKTASRLQDYVSRRFRSFLGEASERTKTELKPLTPLINSLFSYWAGSQTESQIGAKNKTIPVMSEVLSAARAVMGIEVSQGVKTSYTSATEILIRQALQSQAESTPRLRYLLEMSKGSSISDILMSLDLSTTGLSKRPSLGSDAYNNYLRRLGQESAEMLGINYSQAIGALMADERAKISEMKENPTRVFSTTIHDLADFALSYRVAVVKEKKKSYLEADPLRASSVLSNADTLLIRQEMEALEELSVYAASSAGLSTPEGFGTASARREELLYRYATSKDMTEQGSILRELEDTTGIGNRFRTLQKVVANLVDSGKLSGNLQDELIIGQEWLTNAEKKILPLSQVSYRDGEKTTLLGKLDAVLPDIEDGLDAKQAVRRIAESDGLLQFSGNLDEGRLRGLVRSMGFAGDDLVGELAEELQSRTSALRILGIIAQASDYMVKTVRTDDISSVLTSMKGATLSGLLENMEVPIYPKGLSNDIHGIQAFLGNMMDPKTRGDYTEAAEYFRYSVSNEADEFHTIPVGDKFVGAKSGYLQNVFVSQTELAEQLLADQRRLNRAIQGGDQEIISEATRQYSRRFGQMLASFLEEEEIAGFDGKMRESIEALFGTLRAKDSSSPSIIYSAASETAEGAKAPGQALPMEVMPLSQAQAEVGDASVVWKGMNESIERVTREIEGFDHLLTRKEINMSAVLNQTEQMEMIERLRMSAVEERERLIQEMGRDPDVEVYRGESGEIRAIRAQDPLQPRTAPLTTTDLGIEELIDDNERPQPSTIESAPKIPDESPSVETRAVLTGSVSEEAQQLIEVDNEASSRGGTNAPEGTAKPVPGVSSEASSITPPDPGGARATSVDETARAASVADDLTSGADNLGGGLQRAVREAAASVGKRNLLIGGAIVGALGLATFFFDGKDRNRESRDSNSLNPALGSAAIDSPRMPVERNTTVRVTRNSSHDGSVILRSRGHGDPNRIRRRSSEMVTNLSNSGYLPAGTVRVSDGSPFWREHRLRQATGDHVSSLYG